MLRRTKTQLANLKLHPNTGNNIQKLTKMIKSWARDEVMISETVKKCNRDTVSNTNAK